MNKADIANANVLVLGSFNADLVVKTPRFPKPGESLIGGPFAICAGGKGSNQAVAAAKLGANVTMVAKIGTDVFSNLAIDVLQGVGIDTSKIVRDEEIATGVAVSRNGAAASMPTFDEAYEMYMK